MSRDDIDIHDMLNGWVEMILIYIRCYKDESRWYWYTWYIKRMSRGYIDKQDMLYGWVEMILIYIIC